MITARNTYKNEKRLTIVRSFHFKYILCGGLFEMKIMITIIGILIILAGILPFLDNFKLLPEFIPTEKPTYQFIIIAVGVIGLLYGVLNSMLFGAEKFVTIALALLTVLGGILPFIQNFVPAIIPTTGPLYSGLIIIIGAIGMVYGFMALG
mgnify:CR=1 FL=1|jgi:hypothetical protein|tara:strand:- start:319 stop:771 length:453 start_codon:yes stop_codon:yes gene_type:complete